MSSQETVGSEICGRRSTGGGFTLVELLVVISVIALLISILLPSLKGARDQAKKVVCASHLKQISNALWSYWTENNGRVPLVVSPLTDGEALGALRWDDENVSDALLDPFDRGSRTEGPDGSAGWPISLPNVLMPTYIGSEERLFVCPAAKVGWPRFDNPKRMTYRPAAVNQPNGAVPDIDNLLRSDGDGDHYSYEREFFGFLDGRMYKPPRSIHSGKKDMMSLIRDAQREAFLRGVFVRDTATRRTLPGGMTEFEGPHRGGMNVINKRLEIEYRDKETTNEDLVPDGQSGGLLF